MNKTKASKRMSYLLRHCTNPLYIDLNGGYAPVEVIVSVLQEKFKDFNADILREIVAEDTKGRYSFDETGTLIRANQGHSIPNVVVEMESPEPPEVLYHGTALRFLPSIMEQGLLPMRRQYVHISPDYQTAIAVGKRHGEPVVLAIAAKHFVADGYRLMRSANGVWQADNVPPEYLTQCSSYLANGVDLLSIPTIHSF